MLWSLINFDIVTRGNNFDANNEEESLSMIRTAETLVSIGTEGTKGSARTGTGANSMTNN